MITINMLIVIYTCTESFYIGKDEDEDEEMKETYNSFLFPS